MGEQHRKDLGVRLRACHLALRGQLGAQLEEVLEDPVVHDDYLPVGAAVRMRVLLGGRAVSRPARMTDAHVRAESVPIQPVELGLEPYQPIGAACDLDRSRRMEQRHAGAVVAAVLEPPEPIEQDGDCLPYSQIADDSAHVFRAPVERGRGKTIGAPCYREIPATYERSVAPGASGKPTVKTMSPQTSRAT